ncbi:hypothetical protein OESDEN_22399 [Oesophagostomum dentatum]|uniref:Uncharacterized protein n=1 Tax=Oesophagostomum dentatum TaxID=61180 RepID=A0A0B1S272_OESDE|nr:hypothetical protein OESDEN_22399 [Oesophagostomum dentatum]
MKNLSVNQKEQYKQRIADQQGVGDFMRQIISIESNDMSISSAEAEQRENRLKYGNPAAARLLDDLD